MSEEIQFKIGEDLLEEIFHRPIYDIDPRLIVQLVTKAVSLYYTANFSESAN